MYDFNTVEYRMTATVTEMVLISDPTMPPVHAELRYRSDDPFAVQLLGQRRREGPVDQRLGPAERSRGPVGEAACEGKPLLDHRVGGREPRDEAQPQRLVGTEDLRQAGDLERLAGPDQPGQRPGRAACGRRSELPKGPR